VLFVVLRALRDPLRQSDMVTTLAKDHHKEHEGVTNGSSVFFKT